MMQDSTYVQAFLVNCSFPDQLSGVLNLMENNYCYATASFETHLDFIIEASQQVEGLVTWSSPRWAMPGDIVFFYHAGKAGHYINQILKELEQCFQENSSQTKEDILAFLGHAKQQSKQYGSCIFATGQVCSEIQKFENQDSDSHFQGRIFVDIKNIRLLDQPVSSKAFNKAVKLGQNTITPVCGSDFTHLKEILSEHTLLPDYIQGASEASRGFYFYDPKQWWLTAASNQTRFLHETQLRVFFANDLLKTLKDRQSSLLEECRTFKSGKSTGYADYMIQIQGVWIPVETKLNILTEKDLFGQLKKYQNIDSFTVTKGSQENFSIETVAHGLCIVIDHKGIYLVLENQWLHSETRTPWILRTELNPEICQQIRTDLIEIIQGVKAQNNLADVNAERSQ